MAGKSRSGCGPIAFGCVIGAALVVLLLAGLVGVGWWLWNSEPESITRQEAQLGALSEAERAELAERVEQRFLRKSSDIVAPPEPGTEPGTEPGPAGEGEAAAEGAQLDRLAERQPRPGSVRRIEMSYRELNAWLDERLPKMVANRGEAWPEAVRNVTVAVEDGRPVLGVRVGEGESQQLMSAVFNPVRTPDGRVRLEVEQIRSGRMPLPANEVMERLSAGSGAERTAWVENVLAGAAFDPAWQVDATRRARLVDWEIGDEGVEIGVRVSREGE